MLNVTFATNIVNAPSASKLLNVSLFATKLLHHDFPLKLQNL